MSWKQLDINDLRLILSEQETVQLNTYSVNEEMTEVINNTINLVAATWRGALGAKGYTLDTREYYLPSSYWYYVLVHARQAVWTRFPNSENIALDERRLDEYNKAMELLENPFISTELPEDEYNPTLSADSTGHSGGGSIFVPEQRFSQWYLDNTAQTLQLSNYF